MSLKLRLFIVAVLGAAAVLLATHIPGDLGAHLWDYALWVLICVASESMVVPVLSGEGSGSAASTANLATAMLWGQSPAMWVCGISTMLGEKLLIRDKPWIRVVFNGAQTSITMWAAASVFGALGGPRGGLESAMAVPVNGAQSLRLIAPILGLCVAYLLVNRGLIGLPIAWSSDRTFWRVLRDDWFHTERLFADAAFFLLAPIMVLSF
ncbi:MAG: hypothetical protein ACRENS_13775, partial [Candidatus Eiseniibacteriota bacterium]